MNHYYDTTNQNNTAFERKAKTQDDRVMDFFKKYPSANLHPFHVWKHEFDYMNVPITSIRRAFSTLETMGLIEKTGIMVTGQYGKPTNTWRLRKSMLQTEPTLF